METKHKTIRFMAVLLAFVGLMVLPNGAWAGDLQPPAAPGSTMKTLDEVEPRIPISQADIPLIISTSGSYYLTEDVNTSGVAIQIDCNDVTIDLSGYSLTGTGSGNSNGIRIFSRNNLEIRNGTIRNFNWHGIVQYTGNSRNYRLINLRIIANGQASSSYHGIALSGYGNLIKDCIVSENLGDGIRPGFASTIIGNIVYNNGDDGISVFDSCTVTNNTVYGNQNNGIFASYSCTVTGNTVRDNGSNGIFANPGSTVTGNTVYNNQTNGIYASYGCLVVGNTAKNNNQSGLGNAAGIYAFSDCFVKGNMVSANLANNIYSYSGDNVIENNLVTDCTTGYGIYFNSIGCFYADNRASGNLTNYGGNVPVGGGDGGGNAQF